MVVCVFIHNFIKNQQISMQSSLLDFKINGVCDGMNVTHLASVAALSCESLNTENASEQRCGNKRPDLFLYVSLSKINRF